MFGSALNGHKGHLKKQILLSRKQLLHPKIYLMCDICATSLIFSLLCGQANI